MCRHISLMVILALAVHAQALSKYFFLQFFSLNYCLEISMCKHYIFFIIHDPTTNFNQWVEVEKLFIIISKCFRFTTTIFFSIKHVDFGWSKIFQFDMQQMWWKYWVLYRRDWENTSHPLNESSPRTSSYIFKYKKNP